MMNRAEYRNGVLGRLGSYQVAAFRAFGVWELAESGIGRCDGTSSASGGGAKWNPYNTTKTWPNTTDFNSVGVKNYQTYYDGVNATVATLNLSPYAAIREAITTEFVGVQAILEAIGASPWGTSLAGLMAALPAYQANRSYYNGLPIGV